MAAFGSVVPLYWQVTAGKESCYSWQWKRLQRPTVLAKMATPACQGQNLINGQNSGGKTWRNLHPPHPSPYYLLSTPSAFGPWLLRAKQEASFADHHTHPCVYILTLYAAMMSWMTFLESVSKISTVVPGIRAVKFCAMQIGRRHKVSAGGWLIKARALWDKRKKTKSKYLVNDVQPFSYSKNEKDVIFSQFFSKQRQRWIILERERDRKKQNDDDDDFQKLSLFFKRKQHNGWWNCDPDLM